MRSRNLLIPAGFFAFSAVVACGGAATTTPEGTLQETPVDGGSPPAPDACSADQAAPKLTSGSDDIGFPVGDASAVRTFAFDEPVTIAEGAFTVTGGATLEVTPALPATATTFTVKASGLADATDYTLTLAAAKVSDACGHALAADASAKFVSGCATDTTPPTLTSDPADFVFAGDATSVTRQLTFSEAVRIATGAVTVTGGATVAVTPASPTASASFDVQLSGLTSTNEYTMTLAASGVADRCGNALAADVVTKATGQCKDDGGSPKLTSSTAARSFKAGSDTIVQTFTFDEIVAIAAGGFTVDNGATVAVNPALPAKAKTFAVTVSNLVAGQSYNLKANAASISDVCSNALGGDRTVAIASCQGDTVAPKLVSDDKVLTCAATTLSYVLRFDQLTALTVDALAIDGGATIQTVSPALPATSDTFTLTLTNVTTNHTLSVGTGKAKDECDNATASAANVSVGVGAATGTQTFDYSGGIVELVVPACPTTSIEAWGAEGGMSNGSTFGPGLGARVKGGFADAMASRQLRILAGQKGTNNGGGGGSFVVGHAFEPLVIAGGGGGSGYVDGTQKHASIGTSGNSCVVTGGGAGGTDGSGGAVGATFFQSGAGGGLLTNGAQGSYAGDFGRSFVSGGSGGTANATGGFGGGGSGSGYVVGGGGGGYSGGASCSNSVNGSGSVGAGGGSYNAAPNQDNAAQVRTGNGQIVVTWQ